MPSLMAIDQGTSSSRAIVFDPDGRVEGTAQIEFDSSFPQGGWVEQDPETLWHTTLSAARAALANARIEARDLLAIGITNQRETTVVWDAATGRAVHPAIVWLDRRTAERCAAIRAEGMDERIAEITGLVVDPYFSSTKLEWLLQRVPGLRAAADRGELRFGTVDSFLVWRLTRGSVHATDATNASRTQLYDIARGGWDDGLLEYFGVPRSLLPDVKDSIDDFGVCAPEWLGAAVPILGVAGDQQAALIGQGCVRPGMTKGTYGTGCFVVANTGERRVHSREGLLSTVAYRVKAHTTFAVEGSIFSAGVAVKWLRDRVGIVERAADTEAAARRCGGDSGGVYLVPAFTGLGAPHWRADARALLCGLTLDSSRDQIVTATLQSVGFQTADLLAALARDGARSACLRVDGGMVANDWLCQFLADVSGIPVERPATTETTALGAAMLAAVGAGVVQSLDAAASRWQLERKFEPAMAPERRESLLRGWQRAVARALL